MGALLRRETRGPFSGHLGPARVRWAPCPLAPAGLMGNYLGLKGKRLPQGTEWPAPGPCQFTGRGLRWSQPPEDSPDPILRRTLQVWPGGRETGCRRAASRPRLSPCFQGPLGRPPRPASPLLPSEGEACAHGCYGNAWEDGECSALRSAAGTSRRVSTAGAALGSVPPSLRRCSGGEGGCG